MNSKKIKLLLIVILLISTLISCLHPVYPQQMLLQHSATMLVLVFLTVDLFKSYLGVVSFICVTLFTLMHIIGARWIYSYVPYQQWFQRLFGGEISEFIESGRNHYDRFVHFMYGFLLYIPVREFYQRRYNVIFSLASQLSLLIIMSSSLVYELFEWSLTILLSSGDADAYNGQQGDMWDAQKDMALATLGGLIMAVLLWMKVHFRKV